jgi:hypothetical protein
MEHHSKQQIHKRCMQMQHHLTDSKQHLTALAKPQQMFASAMQQPSVQKSVFPKI